MKHKKKATTKYEWLFRFSRNLTVTFPITDVANIEINLLLLQKKAIKIN